MLAHGAEPGAFVVMVDYKPRKSNAGNPYSRRLGGYATLQLAKIAIQNHEKDMREPNTFGGLIDWGKDEWIREYRVFSAVYDLVHNKVETG